MWHLWALWALRIQVWPEIFKISNFRVKIMNVLFYIPYFEVLFIKINIILNKLKSFKRKSLWMHFTNDYCELIKYFTRWARKKLSKKKKIPVLSPAQANLKSILQHILNYFSLFCWKKWPLGKITTVYKTIGKTTKLKGLEFSKFSESSNTKLKAILDFQVRKEPIGQGLSPPKQDS